LVWIHQRAPIWKNFLCPCHLLDQRLRKQHLSVRSVEHIEEPVAIRLHQQFSWLSLPDRIDKKNWLRRIPIPLVVRRRLKVPLQLAGVRVKRQDRASVEVIAFTVVAVHIRSRIARRPIQSI